MAHGTIGAWTSRVGVSVTVFRRNHIFDRRHLREEASRFLPAERLRQCKMRLTFLAFRRLFQLLQSCLMGVSRLKAHLNMRAQVMLKHLLESKLMKILAAICLAVFAVMPAQAQPRGTGAPFRHTSPFRPQSAGTHFIARTDNGYHPRFHYGNGGVVIFDPLDYGSDYDAAGDNTVYQGQVAPQDTESLPYARPTSDPDIVISPYEPHATINVAGIPNGAEVQDPVSNLIFLNP
jgi:hypothetical protein